jgi:hypothetical protein
MSNQPAFHEVQRIRHWWLWAILVLVAGLAWWSFVQQIVLKQPFGDRPGPDWMVWLITAICGAIVPLVFLVARLEVSVDVAGLRLRYVPFRDRRIAASQIFSHEVVAYRPLREWGGWGIRFAFRRGWAYTAYGNRGVQLVLANHKRLLVGSQRPEDLAAALQALEA